MLQYIRNSTQMGQCYKPRQVSNGIEVAHIELQSVSISEGPICNDGALSACYM